MTDARDLTTAAAKAATRQKVARLAFWSIVVAGVVLALKVVAWYITGSVALYSDAAESIMTLGQNAGMRIIENIVAHLPRKAKEKAA